MKIFKYRYKFANGPSKWEYEEIDYYSEEQFAEKLHNEYDWSDKYRGCDVEIVDAPKEFLENLLETSKNKVQYYQERIIKLEKEIESYEKES